MFVGAGVLVSLLSRWCVVGSVKLEVASREKLDRGDKAVTLTLYGS